MKKSDKQKVKYLLIGSIVFMFLTQAGLLSNFGINPITFNWVNPIVPNNAGLDVYVKINTKNSISLATCDLIVNVYDMNGNFYDTATTSSGVATFGRMFKTGMSYQVQARQAAPSTTTYYLTPLTTMTVPTGADAADTVSFDVLFCDQVTTSNPTMVIRNGFQNGTVTDNATTYLNSTDTGASVTLLNSVTNTWYGGDSCVDMVTGDEYLSGVWILWKGTATQPWEVTPDYTGSDATYVWYLWRMDRLPYDANGDVSDRQGVITLSVGSATFNDDATVVIDAFDTFCISDWLAGSYAAALIDGHSVGTTAITTKIA